MVQRAGPTRDGKVVSAAPQLSCSAEQGQLHARVVLQTVDLILEPLLRRPAKALARRKARERGAQQRLVLCRCNAVHRVTGEHIAVIAVDRDKVQLLMRVAVCGIIAAPYIIVIVQRRAQVGLKAPHADGGVVRLDVRHAAVRSCDLKVCASIRVHAGERLPLHPLRRE